jgi:membrane protease YdiL (CAAX protease family)
MHNIRTYLAWLVILATVGYHISDWGNESPESQIGGIRHLSMEERMLLFQTKIVLGAKDALADYLATAPLEVRTSLEATYKGAIQDIQGQVLNDLPKNLDKEHNRYLLRDKAILSLRLNDFSKAQLLLSSLQSTDRDETEVEVDRILKIVVDEQSAGKVAELTDQDQALLDSELLDFAKLLSVKQVPQGVQLTEDVRLDLKVKAVAFFTGAMIFILLIGLSFVFLIFYTWLFVSGRTSFLFKKSGLPKYVAAETFAIYMLAMTFAPILLQYLIKEGLITNILLANVIFILATMIVLLWPILWGAPLFTVRNSFGVYLGSFKGLIKNLLIAPTFYLGSWLVFFTVLIVYGFMLQYLEVDAAKGAHPIVPLLLSSEDNNTPILIALLATCVAPLIEELMFRGALYSALRNYFSAALAIPVSALLFAAIHPQGVIGLVPLTFIGMMLAFLREWRGSLVAPMLAHACVNAGTLIMVMLLMR